MISPGDPLRKVYTADLANKLHDLLANKQQPLSTPGRAFVTPGRRGIQLSIPPPRLPLSTIQGVLSGGSAPSVSDGTEVIDPYAWLAYSIQGAYFVTAAGTTNATVLIEGTPISWLTSIPVDAAGSPIVVANPPPDLTHVLNQGDELSIQLAGSSSDCAGFGFSLWVPY
jgi:hypothetical protein